MNLGNTFKVRSYNFREKLGLLKNIILMLCLVILPIIPHSEFSAYPGGCRAWGLPGGANQGLDLYWSSKCKRLWKILHRALVQGKP